MRWTPRASDAGVTALLGGATRKWARPRGFANWMPRPDTAAVLAQVQTVLAEYQAYLPLTIRQIFYRLVGAHGYEKTDHAYGRLCEHLNRARRARLIDMDAIRDDGITAIGAPDGPALTNMSTASAAAPSTSVSTALPGRPTTLSCCVKLPAWLRSWPK